MASVSIVKDRVSNEQKIELWNRNFDQTLQ